MSEASWAVGFVGRVLCGLFRRRCLKHSRTHAVLRGVTRKGCGSMRITSLVAIFLVHGVSIRRLYNFHSTLLRVHIPISLDRFTPVSVMKANNSKGGAFGVSATSYFAMTKTNFPIIGRNGCKTASIDNTDGMVRRRNMGFASSVSRLHHDVRRYGVTCLRTPLFGPTLGTITPIHGKLTIHAFFGVLNPLMGPMLPTCRLLKICGLPLLHLCACACRRDGAGFTIIRDLSKCSRVSLAGRFGMTADSGRGVCAPRDLKFSHCESVSLSNNRAPGRTTGVFSGVVGGATARTRGGMMMIGSTFTVRIVYPRGAVRRYVALTGRSLRDKETLGALGGFVRLGGWGVGSVLSRVVTGGQFRMSLRGRTVSVRRLRRKVDRVPSSHSVGRTLVSSSPKVVTRFGHHSPSGN